MSSILQQFPLPPGGTSPAPIPELDDIEYAREVLQLPNDQSELQFDQNIVSKASALGITSRLLEIDEDNRNTSSSQSASTVDSYHARTFSTASNGSADTALTSHSSLFAAPDTKPQLPSQLNHRRQSKSIGFSQYDRYLSQIGPNLDQPKLQKASMPTETTAKSLFSVKTKRSLFSVKSGIKNKMRWRRKSLHPSEPPISCICCRDDFGKSSSLQTLPCGHTYCSKCLKVMVSQSMTDEAKMPPRCCTQPLPSTMVKGLLEKDQQHAFLKAVVQYKTPWESRIFCPSSTCGEFIPPRNKVDPKHPFDVTCRKCQTRVCVMCKHDAHPVGKDCPEDWELESVLKMGEKSGWRRCYKCRSLVELSQGCTHMTCRCKAQFCYICGGVWDPAVGCPNYCNGEEELERRRLEEEERMERLQAAKAAEEKAAAVESAEKATAEARSRNHPEFQDLRSKQEDEMYRFLDFTSKAKDGYQARHSSEKLALADAHVDQAEKIKDRHAKTVTHLEDRQIAAEMELQASLDQSERSVRIRLKHMEAYCDGLGRNAKGTATMPARTVTERDLRELGQQYNIRDDMARLHQSKINVMRDRQAKRMEELMDRQEEEARKSAATRKEEVEELVARFAHEEDAINTAFKTRQARLKKRWETAIEMLQRELSERDSVTYGSIALPTWPDEISACEETLVEEAEE